MGLTSVVSKTKTTTGLKPRLEAALHLERVLRGSPFHPIGADRIVDSRDRALANRLVTLALRRHGHISVALARTLEKGLPSRSGVFEAAMRIGIAQLLYADDIPAHSAIHLAVETVKGDRRAGRLSKVANGVLRSVQRQAESLAALPDTALFPDALVKSWTQAYGADAIPAFAKALLAGAPLDLTLAVPDPALVAELGAQPLIGESVRLLSREAAVSDLPGYTEGRWWVQDMAAAIPARLLPVAPGDRVLDLCAAPGGKTAQLAARGAKVTALDADATRMVRLNENLTRLNLVAETVVSDVFDYAPDATFDAILLDAPCSATGTFRRHPEVAWQRDSGGIAARAKLQRKMIAHAAGLLRSGGTLVYCVCSLEPEEGEAHLGWLAKAHPELELVPITAEDLSGWSGPVLATGLLRTTPALALPHDVQGACDGFFAMRLRKR